MRIIASLDRRRVIMTCGVILVALLCGQVMQSFADNPLNRREKARSLPKDPAAAILSPPPVMQGRARAAEVVQIEAAAKPDTLCIPQLGLKRAAGGMIDLSFNGCKARQVVLRHGEVEITAATDASGMLERRIPAFSQKARVSVSFDGETIQSKIEIPDAAEFQHVAIVWNGKQTLRMHAFEFGAKRNQFGHVWAGAPKTPKRATRGNGGFLTRLGDGSGTSAEIYTFPAGQSRTKGVVRLMVEADVTPSNCGQQIDALALQTGPLGGMDATEVALKMPQCDAVGRVVRLQNLFQDMRLAGR
ncbi:MAG: hypothetical protein HKN27_10470 [Silicimonas sp.]|nr:hypothetical protein [Silicimonas sp.]